ncbi:uncharacterized protein METZ01_LOCUS356244, partial [marine metagenome]
DGTITEIAGQFWALIAASILNDLS